MTNTTPQDLIDWQTIRHVYGLPCSWLESLGDPDQVNPHPDNPLRFTLLYKRERIERFIEQQWLE